VQGGAAQDPTRQLELLRGVSDFVEKIGEERVRGVPTTRYGAILDLNKEAAGQEAGMKGANQELVKGLGTSKPPVEVRVDEQNRVRRCALDVGAPMPENAASQDAPQGDDELRTRMGDRVLRLRGVSGRPGAAPGPDHGRLEAAGRPAAGRAVASSFRFY
jgi:hypothetical protein